MNFTTRLLLHLFIFLVFSKTSYSQAKGDSLKLKWQDEKIADSIRFDALQKYYNKYKYYQPDSTLLALDYYYDLAKEKQIKNKMATALFYKANIYSKNRDIDSSDKLFNEALDMAIELNDSILIAKIKTGIGISYVNQEKYQKATHYYFDALEVFQKIKDISGEGRILNNLGGIYYKIGSNDLALEYYNKSLLIFNNKDFPRMNTGLLKINIGAIYYKTEMYKEAIESYNSALEIFESENNTFFISECYQSIAELYYKFGQLDKANEYAKKCLVIKNELKSPPEIVSTKLLMAQITYETNIDEATKNAEAILALLPTVSMSKEFYKDFYELLYKCYKDKNEMAQSLKMYEKSIVYRDSIQKQKNNFAIIREAVKNDFELKLYESKLDNERVQSKLKLAQLKRFFAIVVSSLLLIALVIVYFRKKAQKNLKIREALLEELDRLKTNNDKNLIIDSEKFELRRPQIEASIDRKLNETDWNVLNILFENPEITNKEIAEKVFLSVDGIGSSLRRMYDYFEVKESKYKKIALLTDAIKRSKLDS